MAKMVVAAMGAARGAAATAAAATVGAVGATAAAIAAAMAAGVAAMAKGGVRVAAETAVEMAAGMAAETEEEKAEVTEEVTVRELEPRSRAEVEGDTVRLGLCVGVLLALRQRLGEKVCEGVAVMEVEAMEAEAVMEVLNIPTGHRAE